MTQPVSNYQFLSVKDLLDAREAFHIHLMNKENVIGTALGKYRRRITGITDAKTLASTRVLEDSWPCILVFVNKWMAHADFHDAKTMDDFIPSTVYLPDGRKVPLCVIQAEQADASRY